MGHPWQVPGYGRASRLLSPNHAPEGRRQPAGEQHGACISSSSSEGPGTGILRFPSGAWISAQQGICSRDVNSNLCCALTDLSSGLFDNIPKCKKLGADSLIRLQDKGLL